MANKHSTLLFTVKILSEQYDTFGVFGFYFQNHVKESCWKQEQKYAW